jgi:hypothetical protein
LDVAPGFLVNGKRKQPHLFHIVLSYSRKACGDCRVSGAALNAR